MINNHSKYLSSYIIQDNYTQISDRNEGEHVEVGNNNKWMFSRPSYNEEAANTISKSDYGVHALVIYSYSNTLRKSVQIMLKKELKLKTNKFI